MSVYMTRENARRDKLYGTADSAMLREGDEKAIAEFDAQQVVWGLDNKSALEIGALGDHHPGFRQFFIFRSVANSLADALHLIGYIP